MKIIFEKGEVLSNFRYTQTKPVYKKGYKSECGNYIGINWYLVGKILLSMIILFRLRNAVYKVLREEQYGFNDGRGCINHILDFHS